MKSPSMLLTAITLFVFAAGNAWSDDKSVAAAVAEVNQELEAALSAGDAARAAAIYSKDAQLLPPSSPLVSGDANIANYWQAGFDGGLGGAELETLELDVPSKDKAIEVGSYVLLDKEGAEIDRGKYLVVWKMEDGAWKYHRDIWNSSNAPAAPAASASETPFTLTSTDIADGQQLKAAQVFNGFGCEGGDTAPSLSWSNAPEGTKSFALTVYDPAAPTASGWWHWFVFNIPADVTELKSGAALPAGSVELANDFGTKGYGGACPPPGRVHLYQFTVHALPVALELGDQVSNALAGFMVNANSIASASITAVYNR